MLEMADYSDATEPGQLNGLLEMPFEFVLTQSFSSLSRHAAQGFLKRHKKHLCDAKDVAYQQIEDIDEALNQLVSGQFVMGEHHGTLMVLGNDTDQLRDHLGLARSTLLDVGIIVKVVDLALECGFWAQLPGNWAYRPRFAPITSLNFLCFSPFHNFMSGKPNGNPWGPALTILKTISGTPLYFTDSEFELIKTLGEDSRRFLIKQGGDSPLPSLTFRDLMKSSWSSQERPIMPNSSKTSLQKSGKILTSGCRYFISEHA